jgi:hypothetical protein
VSANDDHDAGDVTDEELLATADERTRERANASSSDGW